jgi:phospholipid/cholesterol/gamma-HCH transport system substrate-binding protein
MPGGRLVAIGATVVVAGLLLAFGLSRLGGGGEFHNVSFVFPHATNLFPGSRVQVDGFSVGKVTGLKTKDGKAIVEVRVDEAHSPLRDGTRARISYLSFPGERVVDIDPGAKENAPLPEGAMITGNTPRIELDQILATLTPDVRAQLKRIVPGLDAALAGNEENLGDTLQTAGPAIDALANVLEAVGKDGPALRQLVTSVRELSQRLVARKAEVRQTIDAFDRNMTGMASTEEALRAGLEQLPGTLEQASSVLGRVPGAAAAALPLLRDLRASVEALPGAAADLRPFLTDLRPILADLRPAVVSLSALLDETPSLLDKVHVVLPPTNRVASALLPVLDFLRPYTPELAGALTNLNSATANYDANGHFLRVYASSGSLLFANQSDTMSPNVHQKPERRPGELAGQPMVDAAGSAVR